MGKGPGEKRGKRQTPETLGFIVVQVRPVRGHRYMEKRSLEWWKKVKTQMGIGESIK